MHVTLISSNIETSATQKQGRPPWGASYGDVRAFVGLLNRRKWHLAAVTALVCALAGLILTQLTPEYRATALVMLDTRKTKVTNTSDVVGGLTLDIPAMQTEIEVLRSVNLLGRVVDKLRLDQDPEYGAEPISTLGLTVKEIRSFYDRWMGLDADKEGVTQAIDNTPGRGPSRYWSRGFELRCAAVPMSLLYRSIPPPQRRRNKSSKRSRLSTSLTSSKPS